MGSSYETNTQMIHAISFQNVSLSYGKKPVLDNVSLDVEKGSFTALLGPNGAGKSTIFNLISGLLIPDSGFLEIAGQSVAAHSIAARKKIGVVFQASALEGELTVLQNLHYSAGIRAMKYPLDHAESLLNKFELNDLRHIRVQALSGGYKRRVEVARALLHSPEILILDEPTVGLDPASKEMLTDYAHELANSGTTVFWITHLLDEIRDDDHVIMLDSGRVKNTGRFDMLGGTKEIAKTYHLKARPAL